MPDRDGRLYKDMDTQTQAQIYLADQRGCSQLDYVRSQHSFNFGPYVAEGREPFGALQLLNDDVLKPGHGVRMQMERNTDVLILPLVGGLEFKSSVGDGFVDVGQAQRFCLSDGMHYELINPYEAEFINYIAVWLTNANADIKPCIQQTAFDLQQTNELLSLVDPTSLDTITAQPFRGFIGRYDGRADGIYSLASSSDPTSRGVFVFVLSGAFEVQNRLLHERDGLSLVAVQNNLVEFEALSNDALLLLLDVPLSA